MTPDTSIIVKLLNVKGIHVEKVEVITAEESRDSVPFEFEKVLVYARPYHRLQRMCPFCKKVCPGYDRKAAHPVAWRGPSLNGVHVEVLYQPVRVQCAEHGVVTELVPWSDGNSRFLPDFNNQVAYLAMNCSKTVVCEFEDINWRTVGHCIKTVHDRLEPNPKTRLEGLKRFCVDETSYKNGHKYITVVYDMDRNQVVWLHEGCGDTVIQEFCELLTDEQRNGIEVVAGDGARWIDRAVTKYFPNAKRCVDFFHVASWVCDAIDEVRRRTVQQATREYEKTKASVDREIAEQKRADKAAKEEYLNAVRELNFLRKKEKRGRHSNRRKELEAYVASYEAAFNEGMASDSETKAEPFCQQLSMLETLKDEASKIKGMKYTLLKNSEDVSEQGKERIELIAASYPDLYLAYQLKERLRHILHLKEVYLAKKELKKWVNDARDSGIKEFVTLADKIERHMENILRSIECNANSAKSEATNTTIKALIKTARGFRNLDNLFALIMLHCSTIVIPLHNRYRPTAEQLARKRELANERRRQREEAKRNVS